MSQRWIDPNDPSFIVGDLYFALTRLEAGELENCRDRLRSALRCVINHNGLTGQEAEWDAIVEDMDADDARRLAEFRAHMGYA